MVRKGFGQVSGGGDGAFRDVGEDLVDLEDFVEVGFARREGGMSETFRVKRRKEGDGEEIHSGAVF